MVVQQQMIQRLPLLLEFLLVMMMAWLLAVWLLPEPMKIQQYGLDEQQQDVAVDVQAIAKAALFGVYQKPVAKVKPIVKPKAKPKPVVVSRLKLKLLGTVVAGERSAAVVTLDGQRQQKVFFKGDEIKPEVTLEEVYADAIVVSNHGKSERIKMLAKGKLKQAEPIAQAPVADPNKPARSHQRINKKRLQGQLRNFSTLLSQARVVPNFVNGKADGFVISAIVPGSLYEQIGLKNGDVIRKVNGEAIVSAQQAMTMYQALQNATSINLELERNGQKREIYYDIQ